MSVHSKGDTVLKIRKVVNHTFSEFSLNRQKIQRHFYRAHACFVKYFLMTKKWQQIKKLAYA